MRTLTYTTGNKARVFDLNTRALRVNQLNPMRVSAWDYEITGRRVINAMRKAKAYEMTVTSRDVDTLDDFARLAEADFTNHTPGRLLVNNTWQQAAYIVDSKSDGLVKPHVQQVTFTMVLLDGCWRFEKVKNVIPTAASALSMNFGYLGYPHGYPHAYSLDLSTPDFDTQVESDTPLGLRFYGPVTNPSILINGNNYQVDATVPDGATVTVNPISEPPTVTLTNKDGTVEDIFHLAHIGNGLGSGDYIFEPVTPGPMDVSYSANMSFDVILYEERSGLPWNTLN